jgi:hypothetical protein
MILPSDEFVVVVSAAAAALMMMMVKCKDATGCNNCAFFVYGVNNLFNDSIFLALIMSTIYK